MQRPRAVSERLFKAIREIVDPAGELVDPSLTALAKRVRELWKEEHDEDADTPPPGDGSLRSWLDVNKTTLPSPSQNNAFYGWLEEHGWRLEWILLGKGEPRVSDNGAAEDSPETPKDLSPYSLPPGFNLLSNGVRQQYLNFLFKCLQMLPEDYQAEEDEFVGLWSGLWQAALRPAFCFGRLGWLYEASFEMSDTPESLRADLYWTHMLSALEQLLPVGGEGDRRWVSDSWERTVQAFDEHLATGPNGAVLSDLLRWHLLEKDEALADIGTAIDGFAAAKAKRLEIREMDRDAKVRYKLALLGPEAIDLEPQTLAAYKDCLVHLADQRGEFYGRIKELLEDAAEFAEARLLDAGLTETWIYMTMLDRLAAVWGLEDALSMWRRSAHFTAYIRLNKAGPEEQVAQTVDEIASEADEVHNEP